MIVRGRRGALTLVAASTAILFACDNGTGPLLPERVAIIGRLERGSTIAVKIVRGPDTTDATAVVANPADAVVTVAPFTYRLTKVGAVTFTATTTTATVTTSVAVLAPPTFLFDMAVNGNRDIYRAALDGLDLERLTTNPGADIHPTASKNTLAFTSFRDANGELYTRSLQSPVETRLTVTAANENEPQLSPDGQRLAYTRDDAGLPRLRIADANAGNSAALTTANGSTIEGSPSWRFASDSLLLISTSLGNVSIFRTSRVPGSAPTNSATPVTGDSVFVEPAWSVDGRLIGYAAGKGSGASRIAILVRSTTVASFVTPATMSAGQPVFLADGRLVFTLFAAAGATSLAWVDPLEPGVVHSIPVTGTDPQHPAIIWP